MKEYLANNKVWHFTSASLQLSITDEMSSLTPHILWKENVHGKPTTQLMNTQF
jgi:hypothetical protein